MELSPQDLLALYWNAPGKGEDKVLAFAAAIIDHYNPSPIPERLALEHLDLPIRTYHALRRAGFTYADQVNRLTDKQLLTARDIGLSSVALIRAAISRHAAKPRRNRATK
jgi:DNA-directed RNA polymerase alpha subunit